MSDIKAVYLAAPVALDADGICLSQTPAGAGDLTINGALANTGTVTLTSARRVTIAGSGNETDKTFTITGTDENGAAQVVDIAGPNNGTVTTTEYFLTITEVSVGAGTAAAVTVGIGLEFLNEIVTRPARVQGVHTVCSATAGTLELRDGSRTGTAYLKWDTVAGATIIDDFMLPGRGLRYETSVFLYGDQTDFTSVVVFYE